MTNEIARILLRCKAVSINTQKLFKFVSGIYSPIYCDHRILISFQKERDKIVKSFVKVIKKQRLKPKVIAGTATAGIPWAAFIAAKLKKPMIYIRKESKEYGKEKLIEGVLEKGKNVLLVEDLVTSGKSSLAAVKAIRQEKGKVTHVLSIFSYGFKRAKSSFKKRKAKLISLTNLNELLEEGVSKRYITEEDKQKVLIWKKNK